MPLLQVRPVGRLMHHSDRGSTYASEDYQDELDARGITCSLSSRGNCLDAGGSASSPDPGQARSLSPRGCGLRYNQTVNQWPGMLLAEPEHVMHLVAHGSKGRHQMRMQQWLAELRRAVSEIQGDKRFVVSVFKVNSKPSRAEVDAAQKTLGFSLPDDLASFYQATNGIQLRWISRAHSQFDEELEARLRGVELGDETMEAPATGVINIPSLRRLVIEMTDLRLGIRALQEQSYEVTYDVAGEAWLDKDLYASLFDFDSFDLKAFFNVLIQLRAGKPSRIMMTNDNYSSFDEARVTDLEGYLELILTTRGATSAREKALKGKLGSKPRTFQSAPPLPLAKFLKG